MNEHELPHAQLQPLAERIRLAGHTGSLIRALSEDTPDRIARVRACLQHLDADIHLAIHFLPETVRVRETSDHQDPGL